MTWTPEQTATNLGRDSGYGSGNAAKDIKTLYKATYLLNREPELVFQQFAQKQANLDIPLNKGDNVEFTRYAPLADGSSTDAAPRAHFLLKEGTTPDPEAYYAQTVNAVLDEYGNFVEPSSRLWLTAFDPKLGGLSSLLGIQSGKSLDLKIQNVLANGFMGMRADGDTTYQGEVVCVVTNSTTALVEVTGLPSNIATQGKTGVIVFTSGRNQGITRTFVVSAATDRLTVATLPYAPLSGETARVCSTLGLTTGDKITAAMVKRVVAWLESQETPLFPDGYYHGVIPAGAMKLDFMNDTEYVNLKHYAAPKDLYRNLIGEFSNVRFHKDTHPYKHTAGTIGTYDKTAAVQMVSIFGREAFGNIKLAGKDQVFEVCPPEFTTTSPLAMKGTMSWKNMYCPIVLNGAWGCNLFGVPTAL